MLFRFALGMLVFVGLTGTIGSLLISVRPLSGLMPPEKLADPDSRFISQPHTRDASGQAEVTIA